MAGGFLSFFAITAAVLAVILYAKLNYEDPALKSAFTINVVIPHLDDFMSPFASALGPDYVAYKGHITRVRSYANHYLRDKSKVEMAPFQKAITAALVYHDIGLWTDKTLAYLEPSRERALDDLRGEFSEENMELIKNIIYWHHKITPFEGPHADIVNAIRKGDWIDATQGLIRFGMPKTHIAKAVKAIPYDGFHDILMAYGPKLYGNDFVRIVKEISSIYKY